MRENIRFTTLLLSLYKKNCSKVKYNLISINIAKSSGAQRNICYGMHRIYKQNASAQRKALRYAFNVPQKETCYMDFCAVSVVDLDEAAMGAQISRARHSKEPIKYITGHIQRKPASAGRPELPCFCFVHGWLGPTARRAQGST